VEQGATLGGGEGDCLRLLAMVCGCLQWLSAGAQSCPVPAEQGGGASQ